MIVHAIDTRGLNPFQPKDVVTRYNHEHGEGKGYRLEPALSEPLRPPRPLR